MKTNRRKFLGLAMASAPIVGLLIAELIKKRRKEATNPCRETHPFKTELVLVKDGDDAVVEMWYDGPKGMGTGNCNGMQLQEITFSIYNAFGSRLPILTGELVTRRLWVREVQRTPIRPEMEFPRIIHYRTTIFS